MSKCDLSIVFDQPGRSYQYGDSLSGQVIVQCSGEVQCDGLELSTRWETHGQGNLDHGPERKWVLYEGAWQSGQTYRYPFSFEVPAGPPTYRGRYLNIDHYVKARANIPWAFDPKASEEFILVPGGESWGERPPDLASEKLPGRTSSAILAPLGVAMIAFGTVFFCPLGVLIPVGAGLLFFALRQAIAEYKTGRVDLQWRTVETPPGGIFAMRLRITPQRRVQLNGVRAKLTAREECVRGSGTDKKTYTEPLFEHVTVAAEQQELEAGRTAEFDISLPVPKGEHYSFHASDNKLIWEAELRIDIPNWPDWVDKRTLCVRPGAAAAPSDHLEAAAAPLSGSTSVAIRRLLPASGPLEDRPELEPRPSIPQPPSLVPQEPAAIFEPGHPDNSIQWAGQEESEPPGQPSGSGLAGDWPSLVVLFDELAPLERYSSERENIVQRHGADTYACEVVMDRVERTFSYSFDLDDRFRNGRTVLGKLAEGDHAVSVQMDARRNEQIDALRPGDVLRFECRPLKWNLVYNRLEACEV